MMLQAWRINEEQSDDLSVILRFQNTKKQSRERPDQGDGRLEQSSATAAICGVGAGKGHGERPCGGGWTAEASEEALDVQGG